VVCRLRSHNAADFADLTAGNQNGISLNAHRIARFCYPFEYAFYSAHENAYEYSDRNASG